MATPPVLIALSVSPATALTVALFYAITNEALGALVTPQVSGAQMNIHPFVIIVFLVVLALAFGLMGALVATPVAAFVMSHLEGFRSREPELAAERLLDEESERRRTPRSRRLPPARGRSEPV
jgi:predicted PurR-regulated permease PerM